PHPPLPSFPTRRSSDLVGTVASSPQPSPPEQEREKRANNAKHDPQATPLRCCALWNFLLPGTRPSLSVALVCESSGMILPMPRSDRKSTRLNSSHVAIS